MVTNVILKRELWNSEIKQRSDNGFFSASDLVYAGNKWRILNNKSPFNYSIWLKNKSTQEFIKELEKLGEKPIIKGKSKNSTSWVHPYLFIDLALAISPELKIAVYDWLYDCLVKYRNKSGDSYKKMCGSLYLIETNNSDFPKHIADVANKIKLACEVEDWENCSEDKLQLRDKIHEYISLLSDIVKDRDTLVDVAVKKAKIELGIK